MKRGMVVMTMDTLEVHTVVMEKRSGPMLTSVPTLSRKQRLKKLKRERHLGESSWEREGAGRGGRERGRARERAREREREREGERERERERERGRERLKTNRWCFRPSQPQRITSGLEETFIKRYS